MDIMLRLKKKYDEKKIIEVEKEIDHFKKHSNSAEKSMVETLHYLETTERFKENITYKNSSFDVYVKDRFCITPTTYQNMRLAYHNFRDESLKYGPGFINAVKKNCGAEKIGAVLKEIKEIDSKSKKPISRTKMSAVMDKHRKVKVIPNPVQPKKETDWKKQYGIMKSALAATEKELVTAKEQIQRLKDTVMRLKSAQTAIEQAAMAFRDEGKQLAA